MTDFEPFDDDLATALQRRAPAIGTAELDTAGAHGAVLARARGIRRRRAGIAGGATLAVIIAGGILLLNGNADDDTLAPASEPSTSLGPETSVQPSTSLAPQTTRVTTPPTSTARTTPTTTIPETALSTMPASMPASTVEDQPPVSIGGQSAGANSSSSSSSSSSSTSSSSSSTSSTIASQGTAPFTNTYGSSGGSITVSWDGSSLSLDAVNPTAGYTAEIEDDTAARIRVRFHGATDSRIEVRFENGQVTERVD